jgi:hypothetical protein
MKIKANVCGSSTEVYAEEITEVQVLLSFE